MAKLSCGIDFGTSNSSVAVAMDDVVKLTPVEESHVTIPSAIFFSSEHVRPVFGRVAMNTFLKGSDGRLMRSLKRVLGTSVMKHGTVVNGKSLKFERIIAYFLQNLKDKTNAFVGDEIDSVVLGRPVHFVDNNEEADKRAEEELRSVAQAVGYKNIEFQFEPIAAAFAHERNIQGEKLAIVADIGGGTSDFTVMRLSNKYLTKIDRSSDILANAGIRVGGNDFDKQLTLNHFLPELGYKTTYGPKHLEIPLKFYHDIAEWSKVNFLYTPKTISQARELLHQSHDKRRLARLVRVLEEETGHTLLAAAEDAKIALTDVEMYSARLDFIEQNFSVLISRKQFEESIRHELDRISETTLQCLKTAGVKKEDINLVILTGGSTGVPLVQSTFRNLFTNAAIGEENKLSSVGLGLAYDSLRKFN